MLMSKKDFCLDRDSFYEGRVFGEEDSDVRAHLEDNGVMTATIRTRNETYHIEVHKNAQNK